MMGIGSLDFYMFACESVHVYYYWAQLKQNNIQLIAHKINVQQRFIHGKCARLNALPKSHRHYSGISTL